MNLINNPFCKLSFKAFCLCFYNVTGLPYLHLFSRRRRNVFILFCSIFFFGDSVTAQTVNSNTNTNRLGEVVVNKRHGVISDGVVKGDGVFVGTDNKKTLQQIFDSVARSKRRTTIVIEPGDYRVASTLTIDVKYVSISGSGARILYDGNDVALRVFASGYPPYDQAINQTVNLQIQGKANNFYYKPKDADKSTGILFESFGNNTSGGTHHRLQGLVISNFGTGVKYASDAYCIDISHSQISYCTVGINCNAAVNSGERISFYNVSIFNSHLAVQNSNPNSNLYLINCSLDYNVRQIEITGGKVFCTSCHFETDRKQSNLTNFTLTGNGSFLQITNSTLLQDFKDKPQLKYFIEAAANTTAIIKDCFISGIYTTSGELATGEGRIQISNISSYEQSNNTLITAYANNVLADGGFEGDKVIDNLFIVDDTNEILNKLNGSNIKIEIDKVEKKTGKRSLKITKTFGPGSHCGFIIAVPVTIGEKAAFRGSVKSLSKEKKYITHGYALLSNPVPGRNILNRQTVSGTIEANNISNWTQINSSDPQHSAPAWATHYYIYFNLFNAGSGPFFIDDFLITKT